MKKSQIENEESQSGWQESQSGWRRTNQKEKNQPDGGEPIRTERDLVIKEKIHRGETIRMEERSSTYRRANLNREEAVTIEERRAKKIEKNFSVWWSTRSWQRTNLDGGS